VGRRGGHTCDITLATGCVPVRALPIMMPAGWEQGKGMEITRAGNGVSGTQSSLR
jgi:hypothetical protein